MALLTPSTVSIIPPNQTSGGSLKEKASGLRYNSQSSKDAALWVTTAEALSNAQSQIDNITGFLRAPLPQPQVIQITGPNGNLIVQIGNMLGANNVAYQGIWTNSLYVGGSGPDTADIVALPNGSITINGATITLDDGGVTTTIANGPGGVMTWPGQATSLISADNATGNHSEVDPFHIAVVDNTGRAVVWMQNSSGDGILGVGHSGTGGDSVTIDGVTGTVTCGGGATHFPLATLSPTDLIFSQSASGNVVDVSDSAITLTNGTNTVTLTATGVNSPGFSANGVPGISATRSFGTSISVGTGPAVTSVSGTGVTSTSGTFVTSVTLNITPSTFTEGLLTA